MPSESQAIISAKIHVEGDLTRRRISLTNDFEQACERYRFLNKGDQDHLVDNIVDSLGKASKPIQQRMVTNLTRADQEFGKRVATGFKL